MTEYTKIFDYEKAADHWTERDRNSSHMEDDALKKRIEGFINNHNTGALATASGDFVRCTPLEYNFVDGYFYLFSEGGLKFKGLEGNKNVCFAIYEPYLGYDSLKGLQVMGKAEIVEPFSDEYKKLLHHRRIPEEAFRKLAEPMNLIKIVPESYDLLDSMLKEEGFASRQRFELIKKNL